MRCTIRDVVQLMRLVRERERARITGVPKSTWYLLMRRGKAPRPVPIAGSQAVGWVDTEREAWVQAQIDAREQPGGHAD